ncbi:MAG TPA: lanthionine synthetase C family protein [Flavisolibacter sp.]
MLSLPIFHPEIHLKEFLKEQVNVIALQIERESQYIDDYGLLNGKAGVALLFGYLAKLSGDKYLFEFTYGLMSELMDVLANGELSESMSSGVAGIAFAFQHLNNMGVLDERTGFDLSEIDEFISIAVDHDFKMGNWDPLHGMVGLGIYFLERNKENGAKKYLEKIVDYLRLMRTSVGGQKVWVTPGDAKYVDDNYNFGMAHGMPGILSFLAQVYKRGIRQVEIEEMICSCLPFLLKSEFKRNRNSSFPALIKVAELSEKSPPSSRLAWCYGDLCVANMLIHCGSSLDRVEWEDRGIEIALKTVHRRFEDAGCVDAPFCNGSVGIVHQYRRLFSRTGNQIFCDAAENWIGHTLKTYYKPGAGVGGYFSRCFDEESNSFKYLPKYGLLEGSAGIALAWLSYLYDIKPDWDIVFLTNV